MTELIIESVIGREILDSKLQARLPVVHPRVSSRHLSFVTEISPDTSERVSPRPLIISIQLSVMLS